MEEILWKGRKVGIQRGGGAFCKVCLTYLAIQNWVGGMVLCFEEGRGEFDGWLFSKK